MKIEKRDGKNECNSCHWFPVRRILHVVFIIPVCLLVCMYKLMLKWMYERYQIIGGHCTFQIYYLSSVFDEKIYFLLFKIFSTVLRQPNGDDKWTLPDRNTGKYNVDLVLPAGVTCSQCILQVM